MLLALVSHTPVCCLSTARARGHQSWPIFESVLLRAQRRDEAWLLEHGAHGIVEPLVAAVLGHALGELAVRLVRRAHEGRVGMRVARQLERIGGTAAWAERSSRREQKKKKAR